MDWAHQAPLSMEFSRQAHSSGLLFPSPGDLPDPGIEPVFLAPPALAGGFFTTCATCEAQLGEYLFFKVLFFNWRIIALQNFVFCQTSTWISHRYTCPLPLEPPFHLLLPSHSWIFLKEIILNTILPLPQGIFYLKRKNREKNREAINVTWGFGFLSFLVGRNFTVLGQFISFFVFDVDHF